MKRPLRVPFLQCCDDAAELRHENLSADAADRYHLDGGPLHVEARAATGIDSAVAQSGSGARQRQAPFPRQDIRDHFVGHAWFVVEHQTCKNSRRRLAALDRAHQQAYRSF